MEKQNHQLVYLFRHKGTDFVKIGMTNNSDCISRFQSFCTYSPYGGEIVGTIKTNDARKLEKELHQKYEHKRLNGEFFLLTEDECNSILYSKQSKCCTNIINTIKQIESVGDYETLNVINSFIEKLNRQDYFNENSRYKDFIDLFKLSDTPKMTCSEVSDYIKETKDVEIQPIKCGIYIASNFPRKRVKDNKTVKTKYFMEPK